MSLRSMRPSVVEVMSSRARAVSRDVGVEPVVDGDGGVGGVGGVGAGGVGPAALACSS